MLFTETMSQKSEEVPHNLTEEKNKRKKDIIIN